MYRPKRPKKPFPWYSKKSGHEFPFRKQKNYEFRYYTQPYIIV